MRIEIVIPTLNRPQKLLNAIGSIAQATNQIEDQVWVYVYYSSKEEFERDSIGYRQHPRVLTRLLEKPYNASEFWNDHLKESHADVTLYLNDDIVMEANCLKEVVNIFNTKFPDLDGICGIRQANLPPDQALQTAFGAIGNKFAERFPDKAVFCKDFFRMFLDEELFLYASSINKLYFDEFNGPELKHLHPAFDKTQEDSTHFDVRKYWRKDKETFDKRRNLNYLWGKDFNLINK
jgi:hypothetical protein